MPRIRFDYTPFGSPISRVVGILVAGAGGIRDDVIPFATAFLASPSLAFTARHVVDDISEHFAGKRLPELTGRLPFGVQLGTADASGELVRWDVHNYHYSPTIDIVGMSIKPAPPGSSDEILHLPRFTSGLPPAPGQPRYRRTGPDSPSEGNPRVGHDATQKPVVTLRRGHQSAPPE